MPETVERLLKIEIRLLQESDLSRVGEIYSQAFEKASVGECWTTESAEKFMRYWFERQPDLFLVAESEGRIIGGIVAGIKPWWNGNHMIDGELFVDPEFQKGGIAKQLLRRIIEKGIDDYNVSDFEGIADSEADFPIKWYEKLGVKRNRWAYVSGNAKKILANLMAS